MRRQFALGKHDRVFRCRTDTIHQSWVNVCGSGVSCRRLCQVYLIPALQFRRRQTKQSMGLLGVHTAYAQYINICQFLSVAKLHASMNQKTLDGFTKLAKHLDKHLNQFECAF